MNINLVICTRNRADSLFRTLDSVTLAIGVMPDISVIVVDNGSTDGTLDVVSTWARQQRFPVRIIHEAVPGLSRARNAAIKSVSGDLVVFTDDDCTLNTNYFRNLIDTYRQDASPTLRGGKVELGCPDDFPYTILTDDCEKTLDDITRVSGFIIGANLVIPRAILDAVGEFDINLGAGTASKSAEDTDYIYRAHRAGFAIKYSPSFAVKHFHGRKSREAIAKLRHGYMVGNAAFYLKHIKDKNAMRHFYWDTKTQFFHADKIGMPFSEYLLCCAKGAISRLPALMGKPVRQVDPTPRFLPPVE